MLPPASATHIARPFQVLTSNVPGDYPPDQWADMVLSIIIKIEDNASDERKRKVAAFSAPVREILIHMFRDRQLEEQYKLAEDGADRYDADLEIDRQVNHAADRIIHYAHEHLVIAGFDLGNYYQNIRTGLCNAIGTNLATSVSITRRWHAHEHMDDPRARKFLALH